MLLEIVKLVCTITRIKIHTGKLQHRAVSSTPHCRQRAPCDKCWLLLSEADTMSLPDEGLVLLD